MQFVENGSPFKGRNAHNPHTGGHIYFTQNQSDGSAWPGWETPQGYPAIYAVADGWISKIDTYFELSNNNTRYGIHLAFATLDGNNVRLLYSIEPFIDTRERDCKLGLTVCQPWHNESFYEPFINVTVNQQVKKGDVLAWMYTHRI